MKFYRRVLSDVPVNSEAAVVIDVCRAFTTAAYAFSAGAEKILLVRTVQEALDLKCRFEGCMIMGEEFGLPVAGFDLWNSPSSLVGKELAGNTLVLRTSAGTQGMVAYQDTPLLLAGSFVNAGATIQYLRLSSPRSVTMLMTGVHSETSGLEDIACADYFMESLCGEAREGAYYIEQINSWKPEKITNDPEMLKQLYADRDCCQDLNRFDFVMRAFKQDDLLCLVRINP